MRLKVIFILLIISLSSVFAKDGDLTTLDLSTVADPHFSYKNLSLDPKSLPKQLLPSAMYKAEHFQRKTDHGKCAETLRPLTKVQNRRLQIWILRRRMICELEASSSKNRRLTENWEALQRIRASWMGIPEDLKGFLKEPISQSGIHLLNYLQRRKDLWEIIGFFQENAEDFGSEILQTAYIKAGELSLEQKKSSAALQFYLLAYEQRASAWLRSKILELDPKLKLEEVEKVKPTAMSPEEKSSFEKFEKQVRLSNYIEAISKGVDYLIEYPQGEKTESVKKEVAKIYMRLSSGRSDESAIARKKAVKKMMPAPADFLIDWAQTMFWRERYEDLIYLLHDQLDKDLPAEQRLQMLMQLGRASLHSANFPEAAKFFEVVVEKHTGSASYAEAAFRLGLVYYRLKKYDKSEATLQKYVDLGTSDDFEVSGRYWLWRSQEKLKLDKAKLTRDRLFADYPLSYFGIRAGVDAEKFQEILPHDKALDVLSVDLPLTEQQKLSWAAIQTLMESSWLGEARAEIGILAEAAKDAKSQILISKLYARTGQFLQASRYMWPALRADPSLRVKENLETIFPRLFNDEISKLIARYNLTPFLVKALIRQESSFRVEAESGAGAKGLMQIMRPTAVEIARDLKISGFNARRDLFDPEVNLRIGSNYLFRLLKAFDGKTPLALAAYNAGIGNVRNWQKNRQDLDPNKLSLSDPDSELWVDELPWLETSGYVKNVLRNWLVYRLLEDPETKVAFPVE